MPTYEYKREDGTLFEVVQKMNDDHLSTCPTTGQNVKRVISGGSGVVYKGEGWYVTDYKNGGRKKEESTTNTNETTTSVNTQSKSDSKATKET